MVEPTESEDLREIDRFCDAMIRIRSEIDRVASGEWPSDESPLRNAPHTAQMLVGEWPYAYTREEAVFPVESLRAGEVLAARAAHRRHVRRSQPRLHVSADRGARLLLRALWPYAGTSAATAFRIGARSTSSAIAASSGGPSRASSRPSRARTRRG